MSVINKMLRDLDHRQADTSAVQPPVRQGTASVIQAPLTTPLSSRAHARRWIGLALLLGAVAVAAGVVLWVQDSAVPQSAGGAQPMPPVVAPITVVSAPVAMTASAAEPPTVPEPAAVPAAAGAMVLRMEHSLSARRALDALLSTPTTLPASVPSSVPAPKLAPASAPLVLPVVPRDTVPVAQRQQQAGVDVLAQAQNLWDTGSRDAAMDLVQQSIAVAERSAKSAGSTGPNPVLLPLVREMARMQLAESRYGAVWEMLTRLESQLGSQPDLWAIRANAAQRLGRHPDSVHAYMMALQFRPDEQRWLLGTAVSLAALGQTSSAAEMAEKARAVGPVSKDILTYLRQAGVPLRE